MGPMMDGLLIENVQLDDISWHIMIFPHKSILFTMVYHDSHEMSLSA